MNNKNRKWTALCSAIVIIALCFVSCRKEKFISDPTAVLEFSADTVLFDTVFTTIGSTTQVIKVYNRHSESIRISSIVLEGGSSSQFRVAVDGINGVSHQDIDILPNDSIYVFVEVTVDPGGTNDPFVLEDNIRFITNGTTQRVLLNAWGQDAYFHGGIGGIHNLPCNVTWSNDKPHVVYGILRVVEGCALTIEPGTQVFVHAKSGIWIDKGKLYSGQGGNPENRVVFQGDRLEADYDNVPGQWGIQADYFVETGYGVAVATILRGGIWIYQSPESKIDFTEIKNGTMGIQVDTSASAELNVDIRNTIISNMSTFGLLAQQAHIYGENILINNCGQACCALTIGGRYDFRHCTFANYWSDGNRTAPSFVLNNYYQSVDQQLIVRPLEQATFYNCIMWGNNADLQDFNEFVVDLQDPEGLPYEFHNCIVDSDLNLGNDFSHWYQMSSIAPKFESPFNGDFHPKSTGGNSGNMIGVPVGVIKDLDGIDRVLPSVGSYEWQP